MGISAQNRNICHRNQILMALPAEALARIEPHLELALFKRGGAVCEAGSTIHYAYFPEDCVLSLLTLLENGDSIETANIGREGAFGLGAAMHNPISFSRCIVQFEGLFIRCRIDVLHSEFIKNTNVQILFARYISVILSQVQQAVACNALHSVQERMSRWLLMMADRIDGPDLPYTHEFLSDLLAVNRKSITIAAQAMQSAGLINYQRGKMQVGNRLALERASCECYAILKSRFDEFLP